MTQVRRSLLLVVASAAFGAGGVVAQSMNDEELSLTKVHFKAPEFPEAVETSPLMSGPSPGAARSAGPGSRPGGTPNEGPTSIAPAEGEDTIPSGPTWINSRPLSMAKLIGTVVLIDFWEYSCINCIRTFAQNKKWYERYHNYGFEIIGVHDLEFDIANSVEHVRAAVRRFGLPYPIVVDEKFQIWSAYHNLSWPNRFLVDAKGFVRFNRAGEGADRDFEIAIQRLLQEAHPSLQIPASFSLPPQENAFTPNCGNPTEEMYVGDWDGHGILSNPEGYHRGKTARYEISGEVQDGRAALSGAWETERNGMVYRGKHKRSESRDDRLEMHYHARELYAVLNVARGRPSRLYIRQDGKDLTAENKGVDVQLDADGRSFLEVREPRMYYLVRNPSFGDHHITLAPTAPGVTVNSFTFGNNCQTNFPHL